MGLEIWRVWITMIQYFEREVLRSKLPLSLNKGDFDGTGKVAILQNCLYDFYYLWLLWTMLWQMFLQEKSSTIVYTFAR